MQIIIINYNITTVEDIYSIIFSNSSLLFFDPEYKDEAPEKAVDALQSMELSEETKQKAEESLRNLLELGGDEDDELLLDIDTQLTEQQLQKLPMMLSGMAVYMCMYTYVYMKSCFVNHH